MQARGRECDGQLRSSLSPVVLLVALAGICPDENDNQRDMVAVTERECENRNRLSDGRVITVRPSQTFGYPHRRGVVEVGCGLGATAMPT